METVAVERRLRDLVALARTGVAAGRLVARLEEAFGSLEAALEAPANEIAGRTRLRARTAERIADETRTDGADRDLERAATLGWEIVGLGTGGYPTALAQIHDPPAALWVRGALPPGEARVAVVGARFCSAHGRLQAERVAAALAESGACVVSGLARGIDAAAHRGALRAGGRTVAVLGCGLDIAYPPEHKGLADEIAASGAVVTEFPPGTRPDRLHFPRRNRVISGLCAGVVVVEAAERSGSLITARHAAEQGRDVMALPGRADSATSAGTHRLIRDGARLVCDAAQILADLLPEEHPLRADLTARVPSPSPAEHERDLYACLDASPRSVDEIGDLAGRSAGEVLGVLLSLELRGLVRAMPGQRYIRA